MGLENQKFNHNRSLTEAVMSDPATPSTTLPQTAQSGLGVAALKQYLVKGGVIAAALLSVIPALVGAGILPQGTLGIAVAVGAILSAFGIASPGLRKKE